MRKFLLFFALLWGFPAWGQNLPPATTFSACVLDDGTTLGSNGLSRLRCDSGGKLLTTPGTATNPGFVAAAPVTRVATIVALPLNTATQLASANANIKTFAAQARGASRVVIGYDNTVCTGTGVVLDPPTTTNGQGSVTSEVPASKTAYWGCAPDAASSVVVVIGQ